MCEIIKTGIEGLDAILNGGIIYEDSVVVIVRGRRGVFKTIMGMQAMLGIQKSFEANRPQNEFPIRFYSLNKNDVILNKMLKGMIVSREVENIKKSKPNNLRSYLEGVGGGYAAFEEDIRQQLLNFDSNTDRFLRGEENSEITIKNNIADQIKLTLKGCRNGDSGSDYLQPSLVDFTGKMNDIVSLPTERERQQACIVVDGLSQMTDEELERLPLETLKQVLRQRAKISILIMNDRKPLHNLDADIIIDMRQNYDTLHNYTYHELNIVKNVKGQFAFEKTKQESTEKTHLTLYLEKNDFGPRFNCRIFKMDAYDLFDPDLGNAMRFNVRTDNGMVVFDVETKEISTMKYYWRDGMNVVLMQ